MTSVEAVLSSWSALLDAATVMTVVVDVSMLFMSLTRIKPSASSYTFFWLAPLELRDIQRSIATFQEDGGSDNRSVLWSRVEASPKLD